ncbi:hypothetical protein FA10DRAFT_269410 [Acaromyces ingoldii]|uniref:CinA C-terminal domain-containing protein n=1 Tax=Acaromyces ingoldii TaxID=215250 RepID=A0A316YFQ7_9BASI|nr:hypothetical protein FA10DRAFT_269410 [Acaromyces ingoldii]PWN87458.1 hypothetical protein FA10DRAFT_269410 [Acaromyces ingoldii]
MGYPTAEMEPLLESVSSLLVDTASTLSIAESTSGGLISAALLSLNGASKWYRGGAVLYTLEARSEFAGWTEEDTRNYRGPTEDVASTLAVNVREKLNSTYTIGEAGVAGPHSLVRSLPPGLTCISIAREDGPPVTKTIMTGSRDRALNMQAFAEESLKLLRDVLLAKKEGHKL